MAPRARRPTLAQQIADQIKERLRAGVWSTGDRLPSETDLAEEFGASRITIRTSLKQLESAGLIDIRHGSGTYVTAFGREVRASLHDLKSLTAIISDLGHTPSMRFIRREVSGLPADAAAALALPVDSPALHLQRALSSDGEEVAMSMDWIPLALLPDGTPPERVGGSTFDFLDSLGLSPHHSIAEIHAVETPKDGWLQTPSEVACVMLKQAHFTADERAAMFSMTYFIEGRFNFIIRRTR